MSRLTAGTVPVSEHRDQREQHADEQRAAGCGTATSWRASVGGWLDHRADVRPWDEAEQRPPTLGPREHQIGDAPVQADEEHPQHRGRTPQRKRPSSFQPASRSLSATIRS
jgi:hypothetical protein